MNKHFYSFYKKKFNFIIRFNLYLFLFFINFATYTIYSALSKYNILLIEIIIYLNFIIFFYLYKKKNQKPIILNIESSFKELFSFFILSLILIYLVLYELNLPLTNDEIAYSRRSIKIPLLSSMILANYLNLSFLNEIALKYTIHIINFSLFLFTIGLFFLIKKTKSYLVLTLFLLINFIFRFYLQDSTIHPPLNHLSSSFLVSIFGLNHYVFRISYFIPYIIFIFILFNHISKISGKISSFLFVASISTFPLLLIQSVNPDHSFWGSIVFTYLLFYIIIFENINYKHLFIIISIGILFRISVFSAYILLVMIFFMDYFKNKFFFLDKIKIFFIHDKFLIIFLISLPLILLNINGTTVYSGLEKTDFISNLLDAIKSKQFFFSYLKQVPIWYYLFFLFIFFSKKKIEIIIFFIFNLLVYFSIDKSMWGAAKYVTEYLIPFVLAGHFVLYKLLIKNNHFILINIINLFIIIFNLYDIKSYPYTNLSFDKIAEMGITSVGQFNYSKNTKYVTKIPYRYDDAFEYLLKKNARGKVIYISNSDYGVLPQIISGYNFDELKKLINLKYSYDQLYSNNLSNTGKLKNSILNNFGFINNSTKENALNFKKDLNNIKTSFLDNKTGLEKLNKIKDLEYILIPSNIVKKHSVINSKSLIENGWDLEVIFYDYYYKTSLILYKKNLI